MKIIYANTSLLYFLVMKNSAKEGEICYWRLSFLQEVLRMGQDIPQCLFQQENSFAGVWNYVT